MGKPLQLLIAATCMAVLGAVGFWGWQQYEAVRKAEQIATQQQQRKSCLGYVQNRKAPASTKDAENLDFLIEDCISRGLLVTADFSAT